MVEIGLVASGASVSSIPVQIFRGAERYAVEEQLVAVPVDGSMIIGVLRRVTKLEPLIRDRVRTPYVDRPEMLSQALVMPYTTAVVRPYVEVDGGGAREVTKIPEPGTRVYLADARVLSAVRAESPIFVGEHKYSGWRVPLDARFANYHIGVFGATGTGKSRLVAVLVSELARLGFNAVVFDHSGVDYVDRIPRLVPGARVVQSTEVEIPPQVIASVIAKLSGLHWQTYGEYIEVAAIEYARGNVGCQQRGQRAQVRWEKRAFIDHLTRCMDRLGARESSKVKARLFIEVNVPDEFFEGLNRRVVRPSELLGGVTVIDMSGDTELVVKQAIVASVINAAWDAVKRLGPTRLVFVIDEAQNYAPSEWAISKDAIETTAREGRKWGLSLVLASQRISGDIDASIRANLGTVFFSRLVTPSDVREISAYMDLADVNEGYLTQLAPREFFVAGLMNPVRKPVLIRVREVG